MIISSYLRSCFDTTILRKHIIRTVKALKPHIDKFDSIAFRGMSGSLVAPAVATKLRKHLIMVRKGDNSHSHATVEGYALSKGYIIIDDFVDSGDTVASIVREIHNWQNRLIDTYPDNKIVISKCVGGVFYLQEQYGENYRRDNFHYALGDDNCNLLYIPCLK